MAKQEETKTALKRAIEIGIARVSSDSLADLQADVKEIAMDMNQVVLQMSSDILFIDLQDMKVQKKPGQPIKVMAFTIQSKADPKFNAVFGVVQVYDPKGYPVVFNSQPCLDPDELREQIYRHLRFPRNPLVENLKAIMGIEA